MTTTKLGYLFNNKYIFCARVCLHNLRKAGDKTVKRKEKWKLCCRWGRQNIVFVYATRTA